MSADQINPFLYHRANYALICYFCRSDSQCVKACHEGRWDCLYIARRETSSSYKLYAKRSEEVKNELAVIMFGERRMDVI